MADELDPRLEAKLRAALRHEADSIPFLVRADDIERARRRRAGRHLALPASLLGIAAVLAILVATGAIGRLGTSDVAASPSPVATAMDRPLVGYDVLLDMLGVAAADVQGEQTLSGPAGDAVTVDLGTLAAPGAIRYAIHCLGGVVTLSLDDGGSNPDTVQANCSIQPMTADLPGSVRPYHVSVTASPAVRWRIVMVAAALPSPSPTPFALASYEELEASLAISIMPVILRGEHPVAELGTEPIRTVVGKVGDVYFEDFAYSCAGGSIRIDKVVGDRVLTGFGTECGDNVEVFTDGSGSVDPAAEIVVTALPQVVWRIAVSGAPMPSPPPSQPIVTTTPRLPPAAAGETGLVTLDLTAADGQVIRTVDRPAGTDEYRLHASCSGSGSIHLVVDGVEGSWDCGAIGTEVLAPDLETATVVLSATVTGDVRFLLRLDAFNWAAEPDATFRPPALSLMGPDFFTGSPASTEAFAGCGLNWRPVGGGGFSDDCGPSWQPVPNQLVQKPGTRVTIALPAGWTITRVDGAIARHNAILPTGRAPDERPWAASPSDGEWTFEAPPLGFWGLRLLVTATKDGDTFQVPYYGRISVSE